LILYRFAKIARDPPPVPPLSFQDSTSGFPCRGPLPSKRFFFSAFQIPPPALLTFSRLDFPEILNLFFPQWALEAFSPSMRQGRLAPRHKEREQPRKPPQPGDPISRSSGDPVPTGDCFFFFPSFWVLSSHFCPSGKQQFDSTGHRENFPFLGGDVSLPMSQKGL